MDEKFPNQDVNGNYESLGSAQGYDEEGKFDENSANSCALISCIAVMKRIFTGVCSPESMDYIIQKIVPLIWPVLKRFDSILS